MAITAGAAMIGGMGVASAAIAVETVMMIGLAMTAVGMVTKSELLMKIGGGLGLGAGVAGLAGAGASGAGNAASQTAAKSATSQAASASASGAASGSLQTTGSNMMSQIGAESALSTGMNMGATAAAAPTLQGAGAGAGFLTDASALTAVAPAAPTQVMNLANSSGPTVPGAPVDGNYGSGFFDSISEFWGGLDAADKSIISGVVKGAGSAAGGYMDAKQQEQALIDRENRRMIRADDLPRLVRRSPGQGIVNNAMRRG